MRISVYYMYCVCGFVIHVFTIVSLDIIGIIVGIRLDPHIPKSALFVRTTVSVYARQIILALVCDPCFVITNLKYFGKQRKNSVWGMHVFVHRSGENKFTANEIDFTSGKVVIRRWSFRLHGRTNFGA